MPCSAATESPSWAANAALRWRETTVSHPLFPSDHYASFSLMYPSFPPVYFIYLFVYYHPTKTPWGNAIPGVTKNVWVGGKRRHWETLILITPEGAHNVRRRILPAYFICSRASPFILPLTKFRILTDCLHHSLLCRLSPRPRQRHRRRGREDAQSLWNNPLPHARGPGSRRAEHLVSRQGGVRRL